MGPFYAELSRLSDELAGGRLTGRAYAQRTGARLMELELEDDVLADWEHQGPTDPGLGHNGTRGRVGPRGLRRPAPALRSRHHYFAEGAS